MADLLEAIKERHLTLARSYPEGKVSISDLSRLAHFAGDRVNYADPGAQRLETDTTRTAAKFLISTPNRDRHGDYVEPHGCKDLLTRYETNPVVFFGHKSYGLPIGSSRDPLTGKLALAVSEQGLAAWCFFHCKTPESEQVFALVEAGELRAASIGFLPHEAEFLDLKEDEEAAPQRRRGLRSGDKIDFDSGLALRFTKWELLEWSVVAIPANSDCIAMRLSRGLGGKPLADPVKQYLEPFAAPYKALVQGWDIPPAQPVEEKQAGEAVQKVEEPPPANADTPSESADPKKPDDKDAGLCDELGQWLQELADKAGGFAQRLAGYGLGIHESRPGETNNAAPTPPVQKDQGSTSSAPAPVAPPGPSYPAGADGLWAEVLSELAKIAEKQKQLGNEFRRVTGKID